LTAIIDGKSLAAEIEEEVKKGVEELGGKGITPRLATLLVGDDPASRLYVRLKKKACQRVGMVSEDVDLPGDVSEEEIIEKIAELNRCHDVHGILVQMPLPAHINSQRVLAAISPVKDVDGFAPENLGKLAQRDPSGFAPATPMGIMYALDSLGIDPRGRDAVIIGHTVVVGKPLALMLLARDATVSVCHVHTKDLASYTRKADILVVAAGKKHLIGAGHVKEGAVVFDVGITREGDKVYGDVDFDAVKEKVSAITPVPGGVGPLTIASLLKNVLKAAQLSPE
jgi:methylenetetrahydrofolate dehydrogenase (NADP+)/methenyltetrahydrofolate cyclohydrolase